MTNNDCLSDSSEPNLHSTLGVDLPLLHAKSTVSMAKKRDFLCMFIPGEYHNFYRELKMCLQSESDANFGLTSTPMPEQNGDVESVDVNGWELKVAASEVHRLKKRLSDSELPVRDSNVESQRPVQKASQAR